MSLIHKSIWSGTTVVISAVGRVITGFVVVKELGPELTGLYSYIVWIGELLVLLFGFAIPNSTVRFLSVIQQKKDTDYTRALINKLLKIYTNLSIAAVFISLPVSFIVFVDYHSSNFLKLALPLLVFAQMWAILLQSMFIGLQFVKLNAYVNFFSAIIQTLITISAVYFWSLPGALVATVASNFIMIFMFIHFLKKNEILTGNNLDCSLDESSNLVSYSFNAWVAAIFTFMIWGRTELFFLDKYTTSMETGFFAAALIFASLITQLTNLVTSSLLPHVSILFGSGNTEKIQYFYEKISIYIAAIIFPVTTITIVVIPKLFVLIFGQTYENSITTAQILSLAGFFSFAAVGSSIIYSHGESKSIRNHGMVCLFLFLGLSTWLVPVYGAVGAAIVRLIIQVTALLLGTFFINKKLNYKLPSIVLLKLLLAALIAAFAFDTASRLIDSTILGMVVSSFIGLITYLILLRTLGIFDLNDIDNFEKIYTKLPENLRYKLFQISRIILIK